MKNRSTITKSALLLSSDWSMSHNSNSMAMSLVSVFTYCNISVRALFRYAACSRKSSLSHACEPETEKFVSDNFSQTESLWFCTGYWQE